METRGDVPILNIVGEKIALGPLRRDLIPTYQRWNNDFATTRTLARSIPTTLEQETAAYDQLMTSDRFVMFTLYERSSWRPIGTAYLGDLDRQNRTAELGMAIGEADCRGKGYGTEATVLLLDYAFTVLGLHSVMLTVYEFNRAGLRAYQKAGFREMGRRRQAHFMGGSMWDVIYMDCLASEFTSPVLKQVFTSGDTE